MASHLVKKFPALYGTRMFMPVFTTARHFSPSIARLIQSTTRHIILKIQFNIIHPRLGLASSFFPSAPLTLHAPLLQLDVPNTCMAGINSRHETMFVSYHKTGDVAKKKEMANIPHTDSARNKVQI
jgi:hypothetical protein